jgi:hypothetical protein
MHTIKTIPAIFLIRYSGMGFVKLIYFVLVHFCLIFVLTIIPVSIGEGTLINKFKDVAFLLTFLIMALIIFSGFKYLYISGAYKPNKSFYLDRLTPKTLKIIYKGIIAILLIVLLREIFYLIRGNGFNLFVILYIIPFYYIEKSIKVHDSLDYVASESMNEFLGLNVDDKILASYQNFGVMDETFKKDDNIIVITGRKIYFAYYNGSKWVSLIKSYDEIEKVGVSRNDLNSCLKIVFTDGISLVLRIALYDKLTTTPSLFIRGFLTALDSYLLGGVTNKSNERRRVSLVTKTITKSENLKSDFDNHKIRKLEMTPFLVEKLKKSEKVHPGEQIIALSNRKLEL